MAIAQRPLVTRRDLLKIFGEDRLVAVIRTPTPELAERAARAVAEGGVRLVEITLTVPDATEIIAKLASDEAFRDAGAVVGAGTVLSGAQAEGALLAGERAAVHRGHARLEQDAPRPAARERRSPRHLRRPLSAPRHLLPPGRAREPHWRRAVPVRRVGRRPVRVDRGRRLGARPPVRARDARQRGH